MSVNKAQSSPSLWNLHYIRAGSGHSSIRMGGRVAILNGDIREVSLKR